MAIHTHFLNVVIPIEKIEQCHSVGGFSGILEKNKKFIGGKVYFDDYLYRDGGMGPEDIESIVSFWKDQGLVLFEEKNGQQYWKDLCVVDMVGGPTLPCEWLEHEYYNYPNGGGYLSYVYLKGKPKGKLISFSESTSQIEL